MFWGSLFLSLLFFIPSSLVAKTAKGYDSASLCYQNTKANPSLKTDRQAWNKCIQRFEEVAETKKGSEEGTKALYSSARLRRELYLITKDRREIEAAIQTYNRVIKEYPASSYADDALYQIALLRHDPLKENDRSIKALEALLEKYPKSDLEPKAKTFLSALKMTTPLPSTSATAKVSSVPQEKQEKIKSSLKVSQPSRFGKATLQEVRQELSADQTLFTFVFDRPVAFTIDEVSFGKRTKSAAKLVLDVANATQKKGALFQFKNSSFVTDFTLKKQFLTGGLHLSFTLGKGSKHHVELVEHEMRVSFFQQIKSQPAASADVKKQKGAQLLRIVIDPGHGGTDTGAIGVRGAKEKDVVLMISKKLASELKREFGAEIFFTRTSDQTLTLEERNRFAEKKKADLFLSIHANASPSKEVSGFQTYFLNNASDEASKRLAARENASAGKPLPEVEKVLLTMLQNDTTEESRDLAGAIQKSTLTHLGKQYPGLKDLRVHSALFYVLVGAKCPGVLIETSFISNPLEERRLKNSTYQEHMAKGIAAGVRAFLDAREKQTKTL